MIYISKQALIKELRDALKKILDEALTLGQAQNIAQGALENSLEAITPL